MAMVKCPECGERVNIRQDGKPSRCAECGTAFRVKTNDEDDEREEEEQDERPRARRKPAARKKSSGAKVAAIAVGGLLVLGLVALGIVLLVRGKSDGPATDQAKVTVENFERVKPGMDRAEVENILGGSHSSSENDMRDAFRKALGEIDAAAEAGFSRFGEGTEWRRWEGKNLRVWVVFATTKEGKRASFSTALQQNGNTYKQVAGIFTWGGEMGHDLDQLNADRKKEDAIRNDKKWVRGAQSRTLLIGDWRKADLDGYVFHNSGKLNTYSLFNGIIADGKETTFRVLDDDHVELLPPQMHPNLPSRPVKYEFRVNRDELVLLSIGQSAIPVHGPYYRVPVEAGRPGYTNVLAPLTAELKSGDWGKQFQAFRSVRRLGKSGTALLPTLLELIRDPKDDVAGEAATTIGLMGADAAPAVPALVELLREPNTKRSNSAVYALGAIGPAAQGALPKLKECLANSKEFNEYRWRDALTYAIKQIEGKK